MICLTILQACSGRLHPLPRLFSVYVSLLVSGGRCNMIVGRGWSVACIVRQIDHLYFSQSIDNDLVE